MSRSVRWLTPAALLLLAAPLPMPRVRAGDEPAEPSAPPPAEVYEQTDRKKTMSIKLPRSWKSLKSDEIGNALAGWGGFYGAEGKSPNGAALMYTQNGFSRALLARAMVAPQLGSPVADSTRQGTGWAEVCVTTERHSAEWVRWVEKNNRVYEFRVVAHKDTYGTLNEEVRRLLDTATVPGESTILPPGDKFAAKKMGDFDVVTDAVPDRDASVKKAIEQLGTVREIVAKALGGKPFDAMRPVVWLYQNGAKYEDRVKAGLGAKIDFGAFSPNDRVALVTILSDNAKGHDEAIYDAGARHYVWQHFGGLTPLWVETGLGQYGRNLALGGGKKVEPYIVSNAKSAVAVGKRRLDQWFDVTAWNEVTDNNQGANELFAWHWYFREGKGAKKYKKQYTAYLQSLRDTGDPAAARKAFDGVNFEEMLQEFKAWAAEWKP